MDRIHGHEHDDNAESTDDGELNYFRGVGSLAKKDIEIDNSYNLFFNYRSYWFLLLLES